MTFAAFRLVVGWSTKQMYNDDDEDDNDVQSGALVVVFAFYFINSGLLRHCL